MECFLCLRYFVFILVLIVTDTYAANVQNHYGLNPGNSGPPRSQTARTHPPGPDHPLRRSSTADVSPDAQRYFPSFSQIFDDGPSSFINSRPPPSYYDDSIFRPSFRTQEFNGNSFGLNNNNREQRESFVPSVPAPSKEVGMLGSGNFGVIRGGTYYTEDRDSEGEYALDSDLLPFYDGNGHGRPPFFRGNPKPLYKNGGNFFENFRDFADITPPTKSFSEFYVVYVNKNATGRNASEARIIGPNDGEAIPLDDEDYEEPAESQSVKRGPKNILEQLAIIDQTNQEEKDASVKSKNKRKLNEHKRKESVKESRLKAKLLQTPKNPYDPLLALS